MRDWQGLRRVYFKDLLHEDVTYPQISPFPTRLWALHYGTNANWQLEINHPIVGVPYQPWNSNFHMGNLFVHTSGGTDESIISTQTGTAIDSTVQPYTDPTTTDGGLEPVIYEFASFIAGSGNVSFCFFYTASSHAGYYVKRIIPFPKTGSETIELGTVVNIGAPATFTPLATFVIPEAEPSPVTIGIWRFIRIYYSPDDSNYGGKTMSTAGRFDIWVADGKATDQVKNYMEGVPPTGGGRKAQYVGTFTHGTPVTSGDSLAFILETDTGVVANLAFIKYCRHWDMGIQSIHKTNQITISPGVVEFSLGKARDQAGETPLDGQFGYELGDRIELQVKSKQFTYADPPVEIEFNSIIDFDGFIARKNQVQGSTGQPTRLDFVAMDYYGQLLKWGEDLSFAGGVSVLTAIQTITGSEPATKYEKSAMNGYGVDPGLTATFAGTKDYKGLSASDALIKLLLFADAWCYWSPEGTLVATQSFPVDAGYVLDTNNQTNNDYVIHWDEIEDQRYMINNIDFHDGSASVTNSQDSGLFDQFMRGGYQYIDSRETNATDQTTIRGNILSRWKVKRRLIDLVTYQGAGWIREGDELSLSIDGLGIDGVDYQVIGKQMHFGERHATRSGTFTFRLCEKVAGEQSIYRTDGPNILGEKLRRGMAGEAYHG